MASESPNTLLNFFDSDLVEDAVRHDILLLSYLLTGAVEKYRPDRPTPKNTSLNVLTHIAFALAIASENDLSRVVAVAGSITPDSLKLVVARNTSNHDTPGSRAIYPISVQRFEPGSLDEAKDLLVYHDRIDRYANIVTIKL